MKICINGDLINLNKVYMITDIDEEKFHSSHVYDDERGEYTDEVDYYINFSFTICFINRRYYEVSIRRKFRIKTVDDDIKENLDYKKYRNEIALFRDSIIEKWDEGSFEYPQFNIEKYEK